ncbi:MAG: alpha/beta hydrolase [Hydrococcus sp. Prado102]|nr:alpha/beta hydrolase [Hydrococcus sp. Prado102]
MKALTRSSLTSTNGTIGGTINQFIWNWQGQSVTVVYETLGQGTPVLMLPAFSTVSTRAEMASIARSLSSQFQAIALDWPGFGQSDRLSLDYQPILYRQLLKDFVSSVFSTPIIIVAAGHAAGYALQLAKDCPEAVLKLVLVAPTWRGPLRAMGASKGLASAVRNLVRSPILGQFLYKLNTTSSFLRLMYGRHVYVDANLLTPEFIAAKREITQQPGARFAPAAFVTGRIDPVENRSEIIECIQSLSIPILVILAENAPPISKGEMEAIAILPEVRSVRLPGTLGIHEENSSGVAGAILSFILNRG